MNEGHLPHWDLGSIFSTSDDFRRGIDDVGSGCTAISQMMDDGASLKEVLGPYEDLMARYETLSAYASSDLSTDTGDSRRLRAVTDVEALGLSVKALEQRFLTHLTTHQGELSDEALSSHAYVLGHMNEEARHRMSGAEEALAADLNRSGAYAFERLFDRLTSTAEDGGRSLNELRGDAYSADKDLRASSYKREKDALRRIQDPVAACLNAIKGSCLTIEARQGWKGPLEHSLFISRLEPGSLDALLGAIEDSLGMFHRYLRTKARLLGEEKLPWSDLFAPIQLPGLENRTYSFDEARELVEDAFSSFSPRLGAFAMKAFGSGWIDAEPRPGKVGGAYDVAFPSVGESRVLTNFTGDWSSVSTLAHELGHAYHDSQVAGLPYLLGVYPMTLAETASIFSEQLLFQRELSRRDERSAIPLIESFVSDTTQVCVDILSRYLFESRLFEKRREGELSAQELSALMLSAQEDSYGDALCDKHELMWAVKGHYYSLDFSFYNYPYAFGQLFALGLHASGQGDPSFPARYDQLLASTGGMSCEAVAAMAGIDITDKAFWLSGLGVVGEYVRRLEDFASHM